jgi:hypothetical protein
LSKNFSRYKSLLKKGRRMSNQTRGRQYPKLFFVVSALCADFEPEARRYTKLGQDLAGSFDSQPLLARQNSAVASKQREDGSNGEDG